MSINDETRQQLARLVRRNRRAIHPRSRWWPPRVRDPASEFNFTEVRAWELIASRLEAGHEVEVMTLDHPPGATGYVMKIDLAPDVPQLYVKLQMRGGKVFGRSFHYSHPGSDEP